LCDDYRVRMEGILRVINRLQELYKCIYNSLHGTTSCPNCTCNKECLKPGIQSAQRSLQYFSSLLSVTIRDYLYCTDWMLLQSDQDKNILDGISPRVKAMSKCMDDALKHITALCVEKAKAAELKRCKIVELQSLFGETDFGLLASDKMSYYDGDNSDYWKDNWLRLSGATREMKISDVDNYYQILPKRLGDMTVAEREDEGIAFICYMKDIESRTYSYRYFEATIEGFEIEALKEGLMDLYDRTVGMLKILESDTLLQGRQVGIALSQIVNTIKFMKFFPDNTITKSKVRSVLMSKAFRHIKPIGSGIVNNRTSNLYNIGSIRSICTKFCHQDDQTGDVVFESLFMETLVACSFYSVVTGSAINNNHIIKRKPTHS